MWSAENQIDANLLKNMDIESLALSPNTRAFLGRVYAQGIEKYEKRLKILGFEHGKRALDAGCGLGQWSFSLKKLCEQVEGIDVSQERVNICKKIAQSLDIQNINFSVSHLEKIPYCDDYFDRIICYSVLYLTNYEESLKELARVCAPGGLIYICTNGLGRYLYGIMARPNPADDFDPRVYGLKTVLNTAMRRKKNFSLESGAIAISPRKLNLLLQRNGFEIIEIGSEGRLKGGQESFLPGHYLGFVSAYDVLARKL